MSLFADITEFRGVLIRLLTEKRISHSSCDGSIYVMPKNVLEVLASI